MPKRKMTEEEKKAAKEKREWERYKRAKIMEIDRSLDDCRREHIPENTTRHFNVGDRVILGNIDYVTIMEVCEDHKYYKCLIIHTSNPYGRGEKTDINYRYVAWMDLLPYRKFDEWDDSDMFKEEDDIRFQYSQRDVYSLLHTYYRSSGLDLNPDYQRGNVWSHEQKLALIDSIFKNIEIGKFAIIRRGFNVEREHYYEMLDGKQRFTTLREFYEDRFRYRGKVYSELHPFDRNHFKHYSISWAEAENLTKEQKYRYFLKLNTSGSPVDKKHLDNVMKMWKKEIENEKEGE